MNERAPRAQRLALICLVLIVIAAVVGCAPKQKSDPIENICLTQTDKASAMEAAEDVLARMHFTIEKYDPAQGIVTTRPLSAAQFFEFWRSDVVGTRQAIEANIHSTRKIAKLAFVSGETDLCIDCTVSVYRLSLPGHDISSSSQAYAMFSKSTSVTQTLEPHEHQREGMSWSDAGQDSGLAEVILKQIEQKLSKEDNSQ
jgi:hypothetical protein